MFNWYEQVNTYFNLGLYTSAQVRVFAAAGWITQEQADEITSAQSV